MTTDTLYDTDFVLWTEHQAVQLRQALRAGSNLPLDWENLAEEIESMGGSQRREVRSLVAQIISHLLKVAVSPSGRPRAGWDSEIAAARHLLELCLEDSPSLKPRLADLVAKELPHARRRAARSLRKYGEDDAAAQVETMPLDLDAKDVLDDDFFLPGTVFRCEPE